MSTHPLMRPSDRVQVLGTISAQSATTVQSTSWVLISQMENVLALVNIGVISSTGTVDAKLQQASDASGTGAKDVTGKAITQLTQAGSGSNKQALINATSTDFDTNNGFVYCRLSITPATAAALIGGTLLGFDTNYPVMHATSVAQAV